MWFMGAAAGFILLGAHAVAWLYIAYNLIAGTMGLLRLAVVMAVWAPFAICDFFRAMPKRWAEFKQGWSVGRREGRGEDVDEDGIPWLGD